MAKSWQQQLKNALSGDHSKTLQTQEDYSQQAAKLFRPVVTDEVINAIQKQPYTGALSNQFLPTSAETEDHPDFTSDPVGDHNALADQGIIHKYHGRVLLVASGSCAVNCRYCFRRHFPYHKHLASRHNWQAVIDYLSAHTEVHEVILSGGDPLTLTTSSLQSLTDQLTKLNHIKTLRIHSRIPTVLPDRIDKPLMDWLDRLRFHKVLVTHINHADELTDNAINSLNKLKQHNVTLLNQSVLLKSVNDDVDTLIKLSYALFNNGVLPYYLHLFDRVQNAAHFEVDISQAKLIYEGMRRKLPGYLLPKMVQEVAGQTAKTPVN
ncbi:EF-P beta-lysylation protein EpmB [Marinicella gelatinilytica]|uniref:EF-P beta-lysylation protein EpmB n=1 Tax=Marinicella gelatinilytica TaxID=2996017 RepID=UPI002260C1EC|nr:EF-P beta-lysylation protein EpmB [Marinicella gelatinilytica]MCX7544275.1 EF-P beta-lysylation protein EpmB [Marinicella gelatinilytica]